MAAGRRRSPVLPSSIEIPECNSDAGCAGVVEPRYPSFKGIMAAKSKPIETRPAAPAPVRVQTIAMRRPPSKGAGRILGTDKTAVPELIRLLHEEAKVI